MVLVDTNVIIDYLKTPDEKLTEVFKNEDIAICGVIKAELIHGARSEKDIQSILHAVSCFEELPYNCDWERLGRMLCKLRMGGCTLPIADVMIAQIAMDYHTSILTRDGHFEMIKKVFPDLMLYPV